MFASPRSGQRFVYFLFVSPCMHSGLPKPNSRLAGLVGIPSYSSNTAHSAIPVVGLSSSWPHNSEVCPTVHETGTFFYFLFADTLRSRYTLQQFSHPDMEECLHQFYPHHNHPMAPELVDSSPAGRVVDGCFILSVEGRRFWLSTQ